MGIRNEGDQLKPILIPDITEKTDVELQDIKKEIEVEEKRRYEELQEEWKQKYVKIQIMCLVDMVSDPPRVIEIVQTDKVELKEGQQLIPFDGIGVLKVR